MEKLHVGFIHMVSAYVQNYKGYFCVALIFVISVQSHADEYFNKNILKKTVQAVEMIDGDTKSCVISRFK